MWNGFALLVGIKQWYGWNKCVWNVCLCAPGPVGYLLPFLVLWTRRDLDVKCKYSGENRRRWVSITKHLPERSASSSDPARRKIRHKPELRAFKITVKTRGWLLSCWGVVCGRSWMSAEVWMVFDMMGTFLRLSEVVLHCFLTAVWILPLAVCLHLTLSSRLPLLVCSVASKHSRWITSSELSYFSMYRPIHMVMQDIT